MSDFSLPRPSLGDPAPDIVARDLEGRPWRLKENLGKTTVVIFHRHIH